MDSVELWHIPVRAFPTVRPVMFFQVWLGAETLGTYGALVGLLTCNHAQVSISLTVLYRHILADHTFSFINICSSIRY